MKDKEPSLKRIGSLGFKSLVKNIEFESDNLYQDSDVFVDNDRNVFYKYISTFRKGFNKFYKHLHNSISPLKFVLDILVYSIFRFRVISILLSVIVDVANSFVDSFKKIVIKNLFWGRGQLFRFTFQMLGAFFLVVVIFSYSYTNRGTGDTDQVFAHNSGDILRQQGVSTVSTLSKLSTYTVKYHVVKAGDTVSRIAESNGISTETLMWANNLSVSSYIRPGDKLILPAADGVLVTVKKGDTLKSIAKKYKIDAQAILDDPANAFILSSDDIEVGDVIFVRNAIEIVPVIAQKPTYSSTIITKPYSGSTGGGVSTGNVGRFLSWPVAGNSGVVSQCYWGGHNGIDIANNSYPSLVAAASGRVVFAGCQSGNCPAPGVLRGGTGLAWAVIIDHGNGYQTIYGHMNKIYVTSGQTVSAGQSIGQMGQTGRSSGVHVHFMLVRGGGYNSVNPSPFMKRSICGY